MKTGDVQIRVHPNGRRFQTKKGSVLMASLLDRNIFLRSDCGGKGRCGKCRVKVAEPGDAFRYENACEFRVDTDIEIEIPEVSLLSSHIITKAPAELPGTFRQKFLNAKGEDTYGIAVDLGTTTIAVYLCNTARGEAVASLAVKNPQVLYGDDVMNRIGAVGQAFENLEKMQRLVVRAIEWGIKELCRSNALEPEIVEKITVVGNPAMIHIFAGVDPSSIGVSPYQPAFYDAERFQASDLGFKQMDFPVQVLSQVSGFIGGDILAAAMASDFEHMPDGTLLIDLGTNGELILKAGGRLFATSCATGPAFEGATLSCGMQAVPGAVNRVRIEDGRDFPAVTRIQSAGGPKAKPSGICGTGVISAVAQFCKNNIIGPGGAFTPEPGRIALAKEASGSMRYDIVPDTLTQNGSAVFISQKDIRSVQLGKAALMTGIEFLLKRAGLKEPDTLIIAGAFGTYMDKADMMTIGMIPRLNPDRVRAVGNAAGAGAVMVLCDETCLDLSSRMANELEVIELAGDPGFQNRFVENLGFPI